MAWMAALVLIVGCGEERQDDGVIVVTDPTAELDSVQTSKLVLVWVGDDPIAVSDVRNHMLISTGPANLEAYLQNPDIVHVALSALVDQYVWGQMAEKDGYELTPAERRQLESLRMELLATRYMADVVMEENRPSREEVEAYYNEHQERYIRPSRVAVRHIQVGTREEAEDIKRQIDAGADFQEMVVKYSRDDNTKDIGGALGYVQKNSLILGIGRSDEFERTVLPMNVGEVEVARSGVGWHVVKVEKKEGGDIQSLDDVFQQISDYLMTNRFNRRYGEQLSAAREQAEVRYVDKNIEAFTGIANSAQRIMQQAAEQPDAGGRLTLLRRVAFEFPDDPLAPEAQFRIAYTQYALAKDIVLARKALKRLEGKWPDSEWRKAGDYLMAHLSDKPEEVGTPEDIIRRVRSQRPN
jgi:hypothetical protein